MLTVYCIGLFANIIGPFALIGFGFAGGQGIGISGVIYALTAREFLWRLDLELLQEMAELILFLVLCLFGAIFVSQLLKGEAPAGVSFEAHLSGFAIGLLVGFVERARVNAQLGRLITVR